VLLPAEEYEAARVWLKKLCQLAGCKESHVFHHPPDWLFDQDEVHKNLTNRAMIQLFGHKHLHQIERTENSLRIGAGAVHPSRKDKHWLPRYNWLSVSVRKMREQRLLEVDVYPRVWSEGKTRFVPDYETCNGEIHRVDRLKLQPWEPPEATDSAPTPTPPPASVDPKPTRGAIMIELDVTDAARTLTYRFLELPHVVRIGIAQDLGLYTNEDEGLRDPELLGRVFQRAMEKRILADLWNRVENEHGDGQNPNNPYAGR
jgi:hypothetical protein